MTGNRDAFRGNGLPAAFCILLAGGPAGCQSPQPVPPPKAADEVFLIHIDRGENGAAFFSRDSQGSEATAIPRAFAFEVAGFSTATPAPVSQEQRTAAGQAAVLDALCNGLVELRRSRGALEKNFTVRFGPRLTIACRTTEAGREVETRLITGGIEKVFLARGGVLQHPPHDFRFILGIFAETKGEFSLLEVGPFVPAGGFMARVACYAPARVESALAGDVAARNIEPADH